MTLLDHLAEIGETPSQFADRNGWPRTTIKKIAYGTRQPSLHLADQIVTATGGKVAYAALIKQRTA